MYYVEAPAPVGQIKSFQSMSDDTTSYDNNSNNGGHQNDPFMTHIKGKQKFRHKWIFSCVYSGFCFKFKTSTILEYIKRIFKIMSINEN